MFHYYPEGQVAFSGDIQAWGVRPVLFSIAGWDVPSYSFFMLLAVVVGVLVYYQEARRHRTVSENTFYIFMAALVGGTLGAKIPMWLAYRGDIAAHPGDMNVILSGRTIVGGVIGGVWAVWWIKKRLGIKERKGNLFAPALAIGLAIGRVGCFMRGCCYGLPTDLPWGVNFGDGIPRHPTQIYEMIFGLILFFYFLRVRLRNPAPGALFKIFIVGYFIFRFFMEFLRAGTIAVWGGLTIVQVAAAVVVFSYLVKSYFEHFQKKRGGV